MATLVAQLSMLLSWPHASQPTVNVVKSACIDVWQLVCGGLNLPHDVP